MQLGKTSISVVGASLIGLIVLASVSLSAGKVAMAAANLDAIRTFYTAQEWRQTFQPVTLKDANGMRLTADWPANRDNESRVGATASNGSNARISSGAQYHPFVKDSHYLGIGRTSAALSQVASEPLHYLRSEAAYNTLRTHLGAYIEGAPLSNAEFRQLLESDRLRLVPCVGAIKTAGITESGQVGWSVRSCYDAEQLLELKVSDSWIVVASQGCYNPVQSTFAPWDTAFAWLGPESDLIVSNLDTKPGQQASHDWVWSSDTHKVVPKVSLYSLITEVDWLQQGSFHAPAVTNGGGFAAGKTVGNGSDEKGSGSLDSVGSGIGGDGPGRSSNPSSSGIPGAEAWSDSGIGDGAMPVSAPGGLILMAMTLIGLDLLKRIWGRAMRHLSAWAASARLSLPPIMPHDVV